MGERRERTTKRLERSDLAALAKQSIVDEAGPESPDADDDPLADWDDQQTPVVATGSQSDALPATSRTATLADPMTTQLLAEVARRTSTVELDPTMLELDRDTQEIDPEALRAALDDAERMSAPAEPAHVNTKRRTK